MPKWYAKFILRMMVRGDHWNKIVKLLPENLIEYKEIIMRLDLTFVNYKQIDADMLLMAGGKSPSSVHEMIQVFDDTISTVQTMVLPNYIISHHSIKIQQLKLQGM